MVAHYTLTVYRADDVTPWFEVSTDPEHTAPYLHEPGEVDAGEVDFLEGRATIGQVSLRVIDPQTGASQAERWLTERLGIPAGEEGEGHTALIGRRALLVRDGSTIVLDGVVYSVILSESFAGFSLELRDIRERERRSKLFARTGTATVLPRGVLAGYGRLPSGGWLIPPTTPLRATWRTVGSFFDFSATWIKGNGRGGGGIVPAQLAITEAMTRALRRVVEPGEPYEEEYAPGEFITVYPYRVHYPDVQVLWRPVGTTTWRVIDRPEGGPMQNGALVLRGPATVQATQGSPAVDVSAAWGICVSPNTPDLPSDGQTVEVLILYVGPPTEDFPLHIETTAGQLLQDIYDGVYSNEPLGVRYDPAALAALTTPVRLRITEPVDDARRWLEEHVYRALGAAPALDPQGRVSPVRAAHPDPDAVLPTIDDSNAAPIPGWSHSGADAVTGVRVTYSRDYRVPVEQDPTGERSAGDGIVSREVTVELRAPEWAIGLMGEQVHEIDASIFRALGGPEGDPVTGDVTDETGAQIALQRAHETIDRWLFGGQVSSCRIRAADFPGLKVGDWVIDARSWRPNYRTQKRGGSTLAQVMAVRASDPAWLDVTLVDAGPAEQPLEPPALGTLSVNADGVVSVPVTSIPAGGEAAVYYAISSTEPAPTSGLWTFLGRLGAPGVLETPPLPAGARVWITARGEGLGRRPSSPLSPVSITVTATPRVRDVRLVIADDGTPTVSWTPNVAAVGVRVYFETHALEDPEPDPVTYLDADASAGELVLPTVPLGRVLTIEVEPWTGYSGGAVSGTPGARVRLSRLYASSAALLVEYSGPAPGENVSPDFDPLVHAYMRQSVDGGVSWTQWARIVGEDGEPGEDGRYRDYRFRVAATQPATPTGENPSGWFDAPPSVPAGQYLWMTTAWKKADGTLDGSWSTPVRLTGEKGDPGSVTPICNVVPWEWTPSVAEVRITGTDGQGGTGGLEYRHRAYMAIMSPPAWSSWLSLPSAGVTHSYPVDPRWDLVVEAQVRIAADPTRESTIGSTRIPAVQPGISDRGRPLADELEAGTLPDDVLIGGMRPPIIARQVSSPSQNLLGPHAGPEQYSQSDTIRYVGATPDATGAEPLERYGLRPGDVISLSAEGRLGPATDWARIRIRFFDSGGNVLATADTSPMVEGTTYTLTRVEGVEIPAGAVSWVVHGNYSGARDFYFRRAMLNRGPIALPYEPPPLRPDRETIDDLPDGQQHRRTTHAEADGGGRAYNTIEPGGGVLAEGTGIKDGRSVSTLFRHREEVQAFGPTEDDGEVVVDFLTPYQNSPAVTLRGFSVICYSPELASGGARLKLDITPANVTKTGFVSRAQLRSVGAMEPHEVNFPAGSVSYVGGTLVATLTEPGASDGRYIVRYRVRVFASVVLDPDDPPQLNRTRAIIAIETNDGSGYVERAAFSYQAVGDVGGSEDRIVDEEQTIIVPGLGAGDQIRLVIKDIELLGPDNNGTVQLWGGDGTGPNPGDYAGITYYTSDDTTESAIPNAGDSVLWLATEVI